MSDEPFTKEFLPYFVPDESKAIKSNSFTGEMAQDEITLSFAEVDSKVTNADIFKVDEVATTISDKNANGYVGLLPGDDGIIQNLMENRLINQKMFSMFISLGTTNSHIKFGGYDRRAIKDGSAFHIVQSTSPDRWRFAMTNVTVAGAEMPDDAVQPDSEYISNRNVTFNPSVPWIYLPTAEFSEFSKKFESAWS